MQAARSEAERLVGMSTANFVTMENFPLVVAEDEYIKRCHECGCNNGVDDDKCADCGASLEGVRAELDEDYPVDNMQWEAERFNKELKYHEVEVRSGYYSGTQFYIEFNNRDFNNAEDMENEDTQYHYGMCRSKFLRKYNAEVKRICKWLDKMVADYGYTKLACLGHFSNGAAVYQKIA